MELAERKNQWMSQKEEKISATQKETILLHQSCFGNRVSQSDRQADE